MVKKNPKYIIKIANPEVEHGYIQFPGEEIIDVTKKSDSWGLDLDKEKIEKEYDSRNKEFRFIHTHPKLSNNSPIPSGDDLYEFLTDIRIRSMAIYSVDEKGDTLGAFFIKKTSKSNQLSEEQKKAIKDLTDNYKRKHMVTGNAALRALDDISQRCNLHYRFAPAGGYRFDEGIEFPLSSYRPERRAFIEEYGTPKFRKINLEQKVSRAVAVIGILGSLFFISSTLTGNAIADLTTKTTSFFGAGLLIVGLVAGFFYVKSRKSS